MTQEYTYLGRRIIKGKLVHSFAEGRTDSLDNDCVYWPKVRSSFFNGAQIGRIYEIGKSIPELWQSVDKIADDLVVEFQARDRAAELRTRQRRLSATPELDGIVAQLRDARRKLPFVNRPAFDLWLLTQLQK